MVMYEIWSLGHKPFEDWEIADVSTNTRANIHMHMQYTHDFHSSKRYVSSYDICTIHCVVPSMKRYYYANIYKWTQLHAIAAFEGIMYISLKHLLYVL